LAGFRVEVIPLRSVGFAELGTDFGTFLRAGRASVRRIGRQRAS
jgi:hypothetical protein